MFHEIFRWNIIDLDANESTVWLLLTSASKGSFCYTMVMSTGTFSSESFDGSSSWQSYHNVRERLSVIYEKLCDSPLAISQAVSCSPQAHNVHWLWSEPQPLSLLPLRCLV